MLCLALRHAAVITPVSDHTTTLVLEISKSIPPPQGWKKKLENFALNIMLANHLLCHSTYTEKLFKCPKFNFHQLQTSKGYSLLHTETKLPPKIQFQNKGSPLPLPIIFRYLRISYFSGNLMLFPLSANVQLHTKQ